MKRILVVDYLTYEGHRNFNKIHVECLMKLGYALHVVGRRSALGSINFIDGSIVSYLPEWTFNAYPIKPISERIKNVITLFWLKRNCNLKEYDLIVFLIYDILSISFFRTSVKTVVINHNNVSQLGSKIKLHLTQKLPNYYTHIALSKQMKVKLQELLPGKNVIYIPHGLCVPSNDLTKPVFLEKDDIFLFCPINRNYDESFVKAIFEDEKLVHYMNEMNIKLCVKKSLNINMEGIISLPSNLKVSEYNYLIQNAVAVILPYGDNFQYRCSGIFFECVSRSTPIISTRLEAMSIYEKDVEMKMFTDVDDLINSIQYYLNYTPTERNLAVFNPLNCWKELIGNLD